MISEDELVINPIRIRGSKGLFILILFLFTSNVIYLGLIKAISNYSINRNITSLLPIIYLVLLFILPFFILFLPRFFKFVQLFPKLFTLIFSKWFQILRYLPILHLNGKLYMEDHIIHKDLDKRNEFVKLLKSKTSDLIVIPLGINTFIIAIYDFLENYNFKPEDLINGNLPSQLLLLLVFAPIISLIYYGSVWVWQDAGVKIIQFSKNRRTGKLNIHNVWAAGDSLSNIQKIVFTFFIFSWLFNMDLFIVPSDLRWSFLDLSMKFIYFSVFLVGPSFLMAVLYYNKLHQLNVNKFRNKIIGKHLELKSESVEEINCLQCNGQGKHESFETQDITLNHLKFFTTNK